MHDVTFDESLFYGPKEHDLHAPFPEHVEEIIQAIAIDDIPESTAWMTELSNSSSCLQAHPQQPAETLSSCSSSDISGVMETDQEPPIRALLTPEATPELTSPPSSQGGVSNALEDKRLL
jgi:hypothetical protein